MADNLEAKLDELIASTNRTTRAVRAFVRFLFIQLSAITLAVLVFNLGNLVQDTSECAFGICPPNPGFTAFAGLIWVVGVVWSSYAGWSELELSNPDTKKSSASSNLASRTASGVFSGYTESALKCSACGSTLEPTERFCGECGTQRLA